MRDGKRETDVWETGRERQTCGRHTRVRDGKRDRRAKGRVMDRETQTKHARGTGKRCHRLRETEKERVSHLSFL